MNDFKPWCDVSVSEHEPEQGHFRINFQLPHFSFTVTATDLLFAKRVLAFVAETRGNPVYRDTPVGGGVYRHMPEKSIDLSTSFKDTAFKFQKLGSSDCYYLLKVASGSLWLSFRMEDELLVAFADGLQEIIDNYCPADKPEQ